MLPGQAEAWVLLALLLHAESRRAAHFDAEGRFVPLSAQDPAGWRDDLIREAEAALWTAAELRQPGPFQIEAATQSAHVDPGARSHSCTACLCSTTPTSAPASARPWPWLSPASPQSRSRC